MSFSLIFSEVVGNFSSEREEVSLPHPYVEFKIGGKKTQTKALKNVDTRAVWKETYTMQDIPEKNGGILEIVVHNHVTLLPDSTIGTGTTNIDNWSTQELSGKGEKISVPLTNKKGREMGVLQFYAVHSGHFKPIDPRPSQPQAGGRVDGVGAGTNLQLANEAAAKAAAEGRVVTIQNATGVATGRPVTPSDFELQGKENVSGQAMMEPQVRPREEKSVAAIEKPAMTTEVTPAVDTRVAAPVSDVTVGKGVGTEFGEIIDRKYYTGVEDRPQEQVLVERFREHYPYTRRFETTVAHTGRERLIGSKVENLGTEEKVIGTNKYVDHAPLDIVAKRMPVGGSETSFVGEGWVQTQPGPICESTNFEVVGDVTIDKERVTKLREHRDFEKEFEIVTTCIAEIPNTEKNSIEQLSRERILREEKEKIACEGSLPLNRAAQI